MSKSSQEGLAMASPGAGAATTPFDVSALERQLNLLAASDASQLAPADVRSLEAAGLNGEEICSLVIAAESLAIHEREHEALSPEESSRLKSLAGVVARSLHVFGSPRKALYWLRQPLRRFDNQSPLAFLKATADAGSVEECLIQIDEGYFA
jgi:putative toxin-antitoxin system antitoxin component (TIGR02293 family)